MNKCIVLNRQIRDMRKENIQWLLSCSTGSMLCSHHLQAALQLSVHNTEDFRLGLIKL